MLFKINKPILLFTGLIIISLNFISVNAQTNDYQYSVKNRWTIKTSVSMYKTAFWGDSFVCVGDFFVITENRKMANFKVEANYGINRFIEIGVFTGFQHYEWIEDYSSDLVEKRNRSFAPLFGVNANFHILPFFVKSKKCSWDLYLTTKYGGCYLPHKEIDQPDFPRGKYRQEYGLGVGVSYYFKNIIGFFAEGSVGQYFYFQRYKIGCYNGDTVELKDFTDSNFSFRIGIAVKI